MIVQLIIVFFLGILGSYFSFYNPKLLSKNIEVIHSIKIRRIASLVSTISTILFFFFINPKTNLEWVKYVFTIFFYFISVIDLYSKIIPNRVLILLSVIGLIHYFISPDLEFLAAGINLFIFLMSTNFLVYRILGKVLFGWGDVKLISVLALVLGWEVLWVIYIAIIISGLLSIIGVLLKKINRKTRIPLGVFLFLGYLLLEFIDLNTFFKLN